MIADERKSPSAFFSTMLKAYQNKDAERMVNEVNDLIANKCQNNTQQWRKPFSFAAYQNLDNMAAVFLNILEGIQQWMVTRTHSPQALFRGFGNYVSMLDYCLRYLNQMNQKNLWFLAVVKSLIRRSKRVLQEAKAAAVATNSPTEKLKEQLFHQLRQFKSSRQMQPRVKQQVVLLIDNLEVSMYFSLHDYVKSERLLELINKKIGNYQETELNNFHFQYGKVALINSKFLQAEQHLQKIRIMSKSQMQLVMRYLIPCKLFLGKVTNHPQYPEYNDLTSAYIRGDLRAFDNTVQKYLKVWIKRGIYHIIQKLCMLVWRNLIKRVVKVFGEKVQMNNIVVGARLMGGDETLEECICIVSDLIFEGYIKGSLYYVNGSDSWTLTLKKNGAFPPIKKVLQSSG